jgi:hypothetical protein
MISVPQIDHGSVGIIWLVSIIGLERFKKIQTLTSRIIKFSEVNGILTTNCNLRAKLENFS